MTWCSRQSALGLSGWLCSAYPGGGIAGAAVPSSGEHGPSPAYNDLVLPAEAASEFYWRITTPPATGALQVFEDLSFIWVPPAADAADTFTYALYKDYALAGSAVVTLVAGSPQSSLAGSITLSDLAGSGDLAGGIVLGSSAGRTGGTSARRPNLQTSRR